MTRKEKKLEKLKRKLQSDGLQIPLEKSGLDTISRNALKSVRRQANLRHGGHQLGNELSFGSNSLGFAYQAINGKKYEPKVELSETAQEIKIRKAAEKRMRKSGDGVET